MVTLFKIIVFLLLKQGVDITKAEHSFYPFNSVLEQPTNLVFNATARTEDVNEMMNLVSLANEPYFIREENVSSDQRKEIVIEFAKLKPENKKRLFELLKPFEKRIRMDWKELIPNTIN